ncbi:hypothetical protein KKH24_02380 [Patescibacteria group bacterium]|nr:hypothetical protein [Patescibacteria group bacterium]
MDKFDLFGDINYSLHVHFRTAPLEGSMTSRFLVRTPRGRHFVPMITQFKPPVTELERATACTQLVENDYEVTETNIMAQVTNNRGVRVIDVGYVEAKPKDKLPTIDGKIGELSLDQFPSPVDVELTTDMDGQRWISIRSYNGSLVPADIVTFSDLDKFLGGFSRFGWVGHKAWAVYNVLWRGPLSRISSIAQLSAWHSPLSM